jgi:hypothetical protein
VALIDSSLSKKDDNFMHKVISMGMAIIVKFLINKILIKLKKNYKNFWEKI